MIECYHDKEKRMSSLRKRLVQVYKNIRLYEWRERKGI